VNRTMILLAVVVLVGLPPFGGAQSSTEETKVRQTVQTFYDALNSHTFARASEYTAEDWININPFGRQLLGRDTVVKELEKTHATILKNTTVTIEEMSVRFAASNVALVTVIAHANAFTSTDGVKHENERRIRLFVVVKRSDRWLIIQDQSTPITRG